MSQNFTHSERLSLIILSRTAPVSSFSVLAYLFPWNYLLKVGSQAIYSCFLSDTMDWFAHTHSNPFWCALLSCRGERPKICCSKLTSQLGFSMWFSFHQSEVLTGEINSELKLQREETEDMRNNVSQKDCNRKGTVLELVRCGRVFQILQLLVIAEAACFWSVNHDGSSLIM